MTDSTDKEHIDQLVDEQVRLHHYYVYAMYGATIILLVTAIFLPPTTIVGISFATYTLTSAIYIHRYTRDRYNATKYPYVVKNAQYIRRFIRYAIIYAIIMLFFLFRIPFLPIFYLVVLALLYVVYLRQQIKMSNQYPDILSDLQKRYDEAKEARKILLQDNEAAQKYVSSWIRSERIVRIFIISFLAFLSLTLPYAELAQVFSTLLIFVVIVIIGVGFIVYCFRNLNQVRIRTQILETDITRWYSSTRLALAVAIFAFLQIMALSNFAANGISGAVFFSFPFFVMAWLNWSRARKTIKLREMLA